MMANKVQLGWTDGPSPYWVLNFTSDTYGGVPNCYYDGVNLWASDYETTVPRGYWLYKMDSAGNFEDEEAYTTSAGLFLATTHIKIGSSLFSFGQINTSNRDYFFGEVSISDLSIVADKEIKVNDNGNAFGFCSDSSGNYYAIRTDNAASAAQIIKTNSSYVHQWTYTLGFTNYSLVGAASRDGDDNIYMAITETSTPLIEMVKISSATPAITWQRSLAVPSGTLGGIFIAVDDSDNVYMAFHDTTGNDNIYLAKWNSSGTIQWQRNLTKTSNSINLGTFQKHLSVDADGNPYVYFKDQVNDIVYIVKISSAGSKVWEKKITHSTATTWQNSGFDVSGDYIYCGIRDNNADLYILRLDVNNNGDDIATANNVTVASTSEITVSTSSLTEAAGTASLSSAAAETVQDLANPLSTTATTDWPDAGDIEQLIP